MFALVYMMGNYLMPYYAMGALVVAALNAVQITLQDGDCPVSLEYSNMLPVAQILVKAYICIICICFVLEVTSVLVLLPPKLWLTPSPAAVVDLEIAKGHFFVQLVNRLKIAYSVLAVAGAVVLFFKFGNKGVDQGGKVSEKGLVLFLTQAFQLCLSLKGLGQYGTVFKEEFRDALVARLSASKTKVGWLTKTVNVLTMLSEQAVSDSPSTSRLLYTNGPALFQLEHVAEPYTDASGSYQNAY